MEVVFGDLDDLPLLTATTKKVDAVIHAGFKRSEHGFLASIKNERNTVGALLKGLKDSGSRSFTPAVQACLATREKLWSMNKLTLRSTLITLL
jgi:hypothetical protein